MMDIKEDEGFLFQHQESVGHFIPIRRVQVSLSVPIRGVQVSHSVPIRGVQVSHSVPIRRVRSSWLDDRPANQRLVSERMLLCLQGCDSSMRVRVAPRALCPQGPLQDDYNSGPRMGAIAGIPSRNRDALDQGTDILAAAPQSIHQSGMGVAAVKGQGTRPHTLLGTWRRG
ncbi:hypothetical protein NHX12_013504 [Muraenolepis orangiensis]|uniref:Uncharacterized protein n=1 Tax=Muraenolepis orangiensis TaxID=630683 RepID=A0A9Q0DEU2_9TELE|nr:hypothetical protein NHX12_013504 [Muraenolepis orangiensis]